MKDVGIGTMAKLGLKKAKGELKGELAMRGGVRAERVARASQIPGAGRGSREGQPKVPRAQQANGCPHKGAVSAAPQIVTIVRADSQADDAVSENVWGHMIRVRSKFQEEQGGVCLKGGQSRFLSSGSANSQGQSPTL